MTFVRSSRHWLVVDGAAAARRGARALLTRVESQPQQLRKRCSRCAAAGAENRLRNSFDTYTGTISDAVKLATELLNDQSEYAAASRSSANGRSQFSRCAISISSAGFGYVSARRRHARFRRLAADGPRGRAAPLLVGLGRDERIDGMPADALRLRNAMETVVTKRDSIRSKLEQLAGAPVVVNGRISARPRRTSTKRR
jgi:hypothetical protein